MKTSTRRHAAAMTFIGLLAIIYLIVLLSARHDAPTATCGNTETEAVQPTATDSISAPLPAGPNDKAVPRNKKTEKGKDKNKAERGGKKPAVSRDNPDVLDLPVPVIDRQR